MKTSNLPAKQASGIYLVGFMGSGKSTIGRKLAATIGWRFVDLDDDIEAHAHKTIAEVFDEDGESVFRQMESEMLQRRVAEVKAGQPLVLALGGGTFAQPDNRQLLQDAGLSIWLDIPFEIVERRVAGLRHRPLARDPLKFRALFDARRQAYAEANERISVTSEEAAPTVDAILSLEFFQ
jgi:shikimate kinase